jgi:four helix bundle protein
MASDFADRAFAFACDIVLLYKQLPATVPQVIKTQLLKAATSCGANLVEAQAASSRRDLTSRFAIALREGREAQYWLRVIDATKLAPEAMLRPRLAAVAVLVAILTKAVKELRKPPKEGQAYPEDFGPLDNAG